MPNAWAVRRTDTGWNVADSSKMSVVLFRHFAVCAAHDAGHRDRALGVRVTSMLSVKRRSFPSSVTIVSPG